MKLVRHYFVILDNPKVPEFQVIEIPILDIMAKFSRAIYTEDIDWDSTRLSRNNSDQLCDDN